MVTWDMKADVLITETTKVKVPKPQEVLTQQLKTPGN